ADAEPRRCRRRAAAEPTPSRRRAAADADAIDPNEFDGDFAQNSPKYFAKAVLNEILRRIRSTL
ncbi:hypothetical protein, partial [Cryobacterium sandaracinum]|uniref:hypothetical protein n=1 Tax=Cryobacterium sandaracinum TaxID=1259247 RepID=UPI00141B2EB8